MKNYFRKRLIWISAAAAAMALTAVLLAYYSNRLAGSAKTHTPEVQKYTLPDTLRIGVLNSSTTYFMYRGTPLGYDYELAEQFAKDTGRPFKLSVAYNSADLLDMLLKREIDIAASPIPVTGEFKDRVLLTGPSQKTRQVLVQKSGSDLIKDVTQLVGREVTVEKGSKYEYRLQNLNEELGGGIHIQTLRKDTLSADDMMDMVARGEADLTVVDSDIAEMNHSDYSRLDYSLAVSFDQLAKWGVANDNEGLAAVIDRWVETHAETERKLRAKYMNTVKLPPGLETQPVGKASIELPSSGVSPYDGLFKQASASSRFDWRMVAAVGYVESRFRPELVSWAGAKGIMQVMPATARAMGVGGGDLHDPAVCIKAGVKLLDTLDKALAPRIKDKDKRTDFVLAAYNAGLGHILDAIALAEKYGIPSTVWSNGVERAALMKSHPEYYRDPVVKNGYFRARETVDFVQRVRAAYDGFRSR